MKTVKAIYTNDMAIELALHPKYGYAVGKVVGDQTVTEGFFKSYEDAATQFDAWLDNYFYKNHLNG